MHAYIFLNGYGYLDIRFFKNMWFYLTKIKIIKYYYNKVKYFKNNIYNKWYIYLF